MELTLEQLARIEENRQRAILLRTKKKFEWKAEATSGLDTVIGNANNKDLFHPNGSVDIHHYGGFHEDSVKLRSMMMLFIIML